MGGDSSGHDVVSGFPVSAGGHLPLRVYHRFAVVTTVAAAIAIIGTVALDHGPGQGRWALTLLPDQHICLVRADQITPDVPEVLRRGR